MNNVLCTICVRGGSKGVKNKNIKKIAGKPLIAYSIEQALASKIFDKVVVSTDSEEIAKVAQEYGAEVFFKRPVELSLDTTAKIPVIRHAFLESEKEFRKKYDVLIDLDATSPLRKSEDIILAYRQFVDEDASNLITAMSSRRSPYFNMVELSNGIPILSKTVDTQIVRRQDTPETYDLNASIYIWKRDIILKEDTLFLENTSLYIMPEERSFDIDTAMDFKIVECLLGNKNA
jgi:CMP-N,N'-diacetyllegionaminic acid synthase